MISPEYMPVGENDVMTSVRFPNGASVELEVKAPSREIQCTAWYQEWRSEAERV